MKAKNTRTSSIRVFDHFDDFHRAAQGGITTKHPLVQVFRFRDLSDSVVKEMPIFRTTFYQIGLMRQANFAISIYEKEYLLNSLHAIIFFKPGQIISFRSTTEWDGYVVLFQEEFLAIQQNNEAAKKQFTLLDPTRESFLLIDELAFKDLANVYERMLAEYDKDVSDALAVLNLYTHILFHKVNQLYTKSNNTEMSYASRSEMISYEFKKLVVNKLQETKTIGDFAEMLHVTPKYLTEAFQRTMGQNPKNFINQRIVSEVKTLLLFSDQSVYEIAAQYGFRDQAHFSNFFKHHTGITPIQFRSSKR